jgi:hypothetical protein
MRNPTNSRRDDIIKAAKYHYKLPDASAMGILRRVVTFHNGNSLISLKNSDLLSIIMHDTVDIVLKNTSDASWFLSRCISSYNMNAFSAAMNGSGNASGNDAMDLLLTEYVGMLTMTLVKDCGSLPENCPLVEAFVLNPVQENC